MALTRQQRKDIMEAAVQMLRVARGKFEPGELNAAHKRLEAVREAAGCDALQCMRIMACAARKA